MKKILFLLIGLFTVDILIQAQNSFYKIYESTYGEWGWDVIETYDKNYVIVGHAYNVKNNDDIYVIKTNNSGDTLWTKLIGDIWSDYGYSIRQGSDSSYIIAGSTMNLEGDQSTYLVNLSENGEIIWSKKFGGSYNNAGGVVEVTDDGGFIILSFNYLRKTNSNGDPLWTKVIVDVESYDNGMDICATLDGGYIIAGNGFSYSFLMKTNSNGDTLWSKTYDYYVEHNDESVKEAPDGGYIFAGTAFRYLLNGSYQSDIFVIKTNNIGDTLWTRTFGNVGNDYGYSVDNTFDGGFIISGVTTQNSSYDIYLIKVNSMGDTTWTKTYDLLEQEHGHSVIQTSDSGFIITGRIEYGGFYEGDIFLLKTDKDGNMNGLLPIIIQPPSFISQESDKNIIIYPNPVHDILIIKHNENSEVLVEIFDINGKCIYEKLHTDYFLRIDFSEYTSGIYILKYRSKSNVITRLVIKSNCY